jgi:hypothetical protein
MVSLGDFALVLPTGEIASDTRARLPCIAKAPVATPRVATMPSDTSSAMRVA